MSDKTGTGIAIAYSDILSSILSGICSDILSSICWHSFWHLSLSLTFFLTSVHSIQHSSLALYLASILTLNSAILSDMLFCHSIWHKSWHSLTSWALPDLNRRVTSQWALPTEIWSSQLGPGNAHWDPEHSRLKSGSAHCDLELAVEVRQYPLRSGARCWEEEDEEEEQVTLIKSRDPHLAGGERQLPHFGRN